MKNLFNELFNEERRKTTLVILIISILLIFFALIIGINDNPPGIILIYSGFISLMIMFVYHWRTAKKFFILFISSIIGLLVFSILYNLLHGLQKIAGDIIVLSQLLMFLSVSFFLIALIVCPPGILIGAVGGILYYFKGRKNQISNE